MKVYCRYCNVSHWFSQVEAEKLIYILQAEHLEARQGPAEDAPYEDYECLEGTLGCGLDSETYLEHVESQIAGRKGSLTKRAFEVDNV